MVLCLLNDFGSSLRVSSVCAVDGSLRGIFLIQLSPNHGCIDDNFKMC